MSLSKPFQCECCHEIFPAIHLHIHHRIPRATGGRDDPSNLCNLCPGCHDALHNIAYRLINKKVSYSSVLDMLRLIYPSNKKAQDTCLELAKHVRNAMLEAREKGGDKGQLYQVYASLLGHHKSYVVLRCKELNLSQEEYFRLLILKDIKSRYSLGFDPLVESKTVNAIKRTKARTLTRAKAQKGF